MSAIELPKAMSRKKAQRWLAEHPGVDAYKFWTDQSDKHWAKSRKAFLVSIIALSVSVVAQIVGLIIRLAA